VIVEIEGEVYGYTKWIEKNYQRPEILDSKELKTWGGGAKGKHKGNHPWRR
jgi:hypothetical protein